VADLPKTTRHVVASPRDAQANGDWLRGAIRQSASRDVAATVPVPVSRKGDWLRGAIRQSAGRDVAATVPVPVFRKKGTGAVAGRALGRGATDGATEPVPFCAPRRGVTAVELVVVILILAIVAAAAVPRYADNLMRARVDAAARRIVADLTAAQARAKATSSSQTVTFVVPPQGSQYQIVGMKDPDHPGAAYVVDLAASPYQVSLSSVNLGGDTTLVYNGYGVPDSAGAIVVQAGNYTKTITIDPSTGIAKIQ